MAAGKFNSLIVKTPEGVVFPLLLAGPFSRCLAWAIDVGCMAVLFYVLQIVFSLLAILGTDFAGAALTASFFIARFGYGMILEGLWRGQTIGKRLLRLRVVDQQGLRLQWSQVAARNLLRVVDALPFAYLVGGLSCLFSARSQRLGDIAANTIVIRSPRILEPDLKQALSDKFNSFDDYPHLEARLRQRVSPQEAGIALESLLRREGLDPEARIDLFREIADHFRSIVLFPQEATDGLSDEKYVRNVVDVLFRSRGAGR